MKGYYRRVKQFHYSRTLYFKGNLVDKWVTSLLKNKFESIPVVAEYHILQAAWRNILVSVGKVQTLVSSLLSFKKNVITEHKSAVVEHSSFPLLIRDVVSVSSTSFPGSQRQDSWQVLEADKRASVSHAICQIFK